MARMKIKFRQAGFRELRTSPGAVADVRRRAQRVAAAAGEGFEALPVTESPFQRAHAIVVTDSYAAVKKNAEENTLIRALEAGR